MEFHVATAALKIPFLLPIPGPMAQAIAFRAFGAS